MLPIYTRYLSTADYGAVGLLTFALAVLEPLFGARLARAIPKFYFDTSDGHSKRTVIWSALILTASVSAVTTVAVMLLRHPAARILFGSDKYALATGLFAVNLLSQPVEYTGMMYIRLQERSRLFLGVSMAKLLLQVALNLLLVVHWRLTVVGVVVSGIISSLAVGLCLTAYISRYEPPAFDWAMTRRMLQFSWPLWFSGIAGLYVGSSGAMYLRMFDSLSDVGLLELGLRFATAVSLLVWTPFFQHWEPVSYRYHKEGSAREQFQVAFTTISALMLAAGLGVSIFAAPVIKVMAAPAFHAAAGTVPLLTLGLILGNLVSFFHFAFLVTNRTKLYSFSQYITVAIITVGYFSLIPAFGLKGCVVAQCLAFAINFIYVYFWSKRYFDPGFDLAPLCIFVLIAAGAYVCASVLLPVRGLAFELAGKSTIFVLASALMAFAGMRAIRRASPSAYASVRTTLLRLSRRERATQSPGE